MERARTFGSSCCLLLFAKSVHRIETRSSEGGQKSSYYSQQGEYRGGYSKRPGIVCRDPTEKTRHEMRSADYRGQSDCQTNSDQDHHFS